MRVGRGVRRGQAWFRAFFSRFEDEGEVNASVVVEPDPVLSLA